MKRPSTWTNWEICGHRIGDRCRHLFPTINRDEAECSAPAQAHITEQSTENDVTEVRQSNKFLNLNDKTVFDEQIFGVQFVPLCSVWPCIGRTHSQ